MPNSPHFILLGSFQVGECTFCRGIRGQTILLSPLDEVEVPLEGHSYAPTEKIFLASPQIGA